jgi:hypothetical protein
MNATLSSLHAAKVKHQQAPTIKMFHTAGQAIPDDSSVLQATIGLADQIRAQARRSSGAADCHRASSLR